MDKIHGHIISNTHWDREWRYPFQAYRMDLVDMMDRLLDLLERREDYRAFHLDSQTVILDDYLEIRPESEGRIRRLVKANRLQIGPWFTLPDMWCCPGEALVRNLLMGHRGARRFGRVAKVGYTPFSNGQISQLPQIYRGFGIDSVFFYRGVGKHVAKSEFLWEGADGTVIDAFRFGDYARYNYYYLVYRPGLLGRWPQDRDYTWDPDEIPWRVAVEQAQDRQWAWLDQRLRVRPENLRRAVDDAVNFTSADATSPHLLMMMGHDHSFAAEEELDLIAALQGVLDPQREAFYHSSLEEYLRAFRETKPPLETLRGEMRHPNKVGLWTNLFALILSCRLPLKQRNARVCAKVLHAAEPLAAAAWLTGSEYPAAFLDQVWRRILINQAHDAIGGCSVDAVHREMLARWSEVETLADEIARRSMRDLIRRIDGGAIATEHMQLTVFNPLPFERTEVAEFLIDLPHAAAGTPFAVETRDGRAVPLEILEQSDHLATVEGGYELSMPLQVRRCRARLHLTGLPAMGHDMFVVKPGQQPSAAGPPILRPPRTLENEFLVVEINSNGTLRLTDKRSGRVTDQLCHFEDTAEFGDPWTRVVPPGDVPLLSLDARATVTPLPGGPLSGSLRAQLTFSVPRGKGADSARSVERIDLPITLDVTLKRGASQVEVAVALENRATDHRLRLLLPTGLPAAKTSHAEGQFDVLERPIETPDPTGWKEPPYTTHPMWNFVDVSDGEHGFAVINDGLTEYEVIDDAPRTLAITLLRCFGKFTFGRPTPEAQCPGRHVYRFALVPHAGTWADADLPRRTAEFIAPVLAIQSAPTRGASPARRSFLRVDPPSVVVSGIKRSEDRKSLVVRLWNPGARPERVTVHTELALAKASRVTLEEKSVGALRVHNGHRVAFDLGPKRIETLALRFDQASAAF